MAHALICLINKIFHMSCLIPSHHLCKNPSPSTVQPRRSYPQPSSHSCTGNHWGLALPTLQDHSWDEVSLRAWSFETKQPYSFIVNLEILHSCTPTVATLSSQSSQFTDTIHFHGAKQQHECLARTNLLRDTNSNPFCHRSPLGIKYFFFMILPNPDELVSPHFP